MKKYIIIERFRLDSNNRGNSALCYGTLSFLAKYHNLGDQSLLNFHKYNNFLKKSNRTTIHKKLNVAGKEYDYTIVPVHSLEYLLFTKLGIRLPFTTFGKTIKKIDYVASDFGGDGFSDIYGKKTFYSRIVETKVAMKANIPLIVLPQTLGPFSDPHIKKTADKILKYASHIYTRDNKYEQELNDLNLPHKQTNDLSAFMLPEKWDINIDTPNAIGLNISGLAYSGGWKGLKGQFSNYPLLIDKIIEYFKSRGKTVYLIPHSYNFHNPVPDNDDLEACKLAYERQKDKENIVLIDKDLTAPQVKYLISQMSFFVGTRMHSNYAAIFTNVPLFGLAYSYKFEGAFNQNGLYDQTYMITNLKEENINDVIEKIAKVYTANLKK